MRKDRHRFWQKHVETWQKSDLTRKTYCEQAKVNYTIFCRWEKRFATEAGQTRASRFVRVGLKPKAPAPRGGAINIVLPSGIRIEASAEADLALLAAIVGSLKGVSG